jgi:hypothetical protein
MADNGTTFDIAGLQLCIKGQDIGNLPDVLKRFLIPHKKPLKNIPRFPASHFFLKGPSGYIKKEFNDRILSYAYSQILAMNRGLLLHSTAVLKNGKIFLFLGTSGGGKSTVAAISKDHKVIGDDVVAVRKIRSAFYAFSTPWRQSGAVITDRRIKGKVHALYFLNKSKRIRFEPLAQERALAAMLARQIHFLNHTEMPLIEKAFFTACELARAVPAYRMEFKKDEDFWPSLEDAL